MQRAAHDGMVRCGIVSHALSCHHACSSSVISTTRRLSFRGKLYSECPFLLSLPQRNRPTATTSPLKSLKERMPFANRVARVWARWGGAASCMLLRSFLIACLNASEEGKRRELRAEWHPAPRRAAMTLFSAVKRGLVSSWVRKGRSKKEGRGTSLILSQGGAIHK